MTITQQEWNAMIDSMTWLSEEERDDLKRRHDEDELTPERG